ncbi:MAG TPA: ABC transporter substrate-binding protein [Phototrophicaceae bacterium]|nr:ABC transporter substrate-binding protein [Phototrophicaceae bacterium]
MKNTLRLTVISLMILMLTSLAGSLVMAQDATTVTVAFAESQPNSLDPHAAAVADEVLTMRNVCEGLTGYDPLTLEPVPALAESWEVSEDGTVYTFKLREGVTFFDGSTLDSADVKYSLDRLSDPAFGTSYMARLVLGDVLGWDTARPVAPAVSDGTPTPEPIEPAHAISGVEVVDPTTVKISLRAPVTSFLTRLNLVAGSIVSEGSTDFSAGPNCTGPFKVSEWVQSDHLTLVANDSYWGGAPDVKQVVIRVIPEASSQVIEFEAGTLDMSNAPEADLPRIRADDTLNAQLVSIPTLSNYNFRINLKDPKLSDVRVRRALSLAIDRQLIVDTVLQGQGTPAVGLYPPGLTTHDDSFNPFPHDVEAAKALLADAGYPDGIELTIRTDQNETENRVLNAIAATVAEAGITFVVNSTEASVYTQDRTACTMELGGIRWGMDYPDPENMVVLLLPNAATRVNCGYGDVDVYPQIKELYDQGVSMPLGADRDAVFRQIEQIAMDNVLILPVYHGVSTRLVSSRLGGTPVDNNGVMRFALIKLS